jgi:FixJ family two-component response regulator
MKTNRAVVMIVDDDESMRRSARRLIRTYGLAVDTFASAEEFLASGRLQETGCLVLDIQMPDLNGLELQSRLIDLGHRIPIIFITAFTDDAARDQAMKAGALCFLVKPFEETDLLKCVNSALNSNPGSALG